MPDLQTPGMSTIQETPLDPKALTLIQEALYEGLIQAYEVRGETAHPKNTYTLVPAYSPDEAQLCFSGTEVIGYLKWLRKKKAGVLPKSRVGPPSEDEITQALRVMLDAFGAFPHIHALPARSKLKKAGFDGQACLNAWKQHKVIAWQKVWNGHSEVSAFTIDRSHPMWLRALSQARAEHGVLQ